MRLILSALIALLLSVGAAPAQPAAPLDVDEAFALSVARDGETLELRWSIAPGYYLYRDNVRISQGTDELPVTISEGVTKDDPGFGTVEVIFEQAVATVTPKSGEPLRVDYQGCQDGGICYRPETRMIVPDTLAVANAVSGFAAPAMADDSLAAAGIAIADDGGEAKGNKQVRYPLAKDNAPRSSRHFSIGSMWITRELLIARNSLTALQCLAFSCPRKTPLT